MEIEYLNSILYLQYNTIAEEAHSHPVCEGFFIIMLVVSKLEYFTLDDVDSINQNSNVIILLYVFLFVVIKLKPILV